MIEQEMKDEKKKSFAEALSSQFSSCSLILITLPIATDLVVKETKDVNPEKYYSFKAQFRDFIDLMEKQIPDMKEALSKMP